HQDPRNSHHFLPQRIHEQYLSVTWLEEVHANEHRKWHSTENPAGQPPLRCANPHLTLDAHALTNHMGSLVENLSQIAAGLFLNQNRRDHELQIGHWHATAEVHHGLAKWQSETLLIGGAAKLGTQPLLGFLG